METILTIDFDVIMWPSIELYNHFINGDNDNMWDIETDFPLLQYANADLELYYKLTNFLLKYKEKNIKFIFINSHDEILKYINSPCTMINIDHHHDLGYEQYHWQCKDLLCGNWGYLGLKTGLIKTFTWLHGPSSSPIRIPEAYVLHNGSLILEKNILDYKLQELMTPDKIVICSSYSWIPTTIRPLFTLWEQLFKGEK